MFRKPAQDQAPVPEKKVTYKQNDQIESQSIESEVPLVEPITPREPMNIPKEKPEEPFYKDPKFIRTGIALAPLILGSAMGDANAGAEASRAMIDAEIKNSREDDQKAAKSSAEKELANMRLMRELMKNKREEMKAKKAGGLKDSDVMVVKGPDGQPLVQTIDESVGQEAYYQPGKNGMDYEEWAKREALKLKNAKDRDAHKAGLKGQGEKKMDAYQQAKSENEIARMYAQDSKQTMAMSQAYSRFQGALRLPRSTANDLAIVFNYMKILDPDSVVREGEQASAKNAGSVPDAIRTMYNRILMGEDVSLPTGLRERFFNQATELYRGQKQFQSGIDQFYKDTAGRRGLDSRNVIRPTPEPEGFSSRVDRKTPQTLQTQYIRMNPETGKPEEKWFDKSKLTQRMKQDLLKDGYQEIK